MRSVCRAAGAVVVAVSLAACKESTKPLVPATLEAMFTAPTNAVAGFPLAQTPAVRVTTADGKPVPNTRVTFALTAGGGVISGASQTTDGNGVARLGSWQLGGTVGVNTATASVATLPPIQFNVTSIPGAAVKLGVGIAPTSTMPNREQFPVQPVVQVQDAFGNAVAQAGVVVTVELNGSTATLLGTKTATTNASGAATFTDLSIAGTAGAKVLNFSAPSLTSVTATVTTTAGAASAIAVHAGDAQSAGAGTAVNTPPAAKVTDIDGNGVPNVLVTFAVETGGGNLSGPTTTTNGSGIASVGSWILGASAGPNTLSATANIALSGNPVTFSATGVPFTVASITPALLAPGVTATLTGTGFNPTPASNGITVDGASANVLTATPTEITFVVPNNMPCQATHDGTVVLTITGGSISRTHPVQPGTLRTLAPGQMIVVGDAAQTRCNELSTTGGLYYINVHNTSETFTPTPAAFELRGAYATGAMSLRAAAARSLEAPALLAAPPRAASGSAAREPILPENERAHLRLLEENTRFLERNARGHYARLKARAATRTPRAALTRQSAVGDQVTLRVPNATAVPFTCTNFFNVTGRVVYQGTRAIIVEDNANPLAGTIDTTYQAIGQEFDAVMFDILSNNYGNPLAMDDVTDNNDRIVMVFTNTINVSMPTLGGFVVSCDLFERNTTNNTTSNFGEYFYARVPTAAGSINTANSPPRWAWLMRSTIIHESKHITSFAERISRDADVFEESWLEESTAALSEELYGRAIYNQTQRANIAYGDAGNPAGPYCDVRPTFPACAGKPLTTSAHFQGLNREWYASPEMRSPLGRASANDFSFYNTGWTLVRWALDQSVTAETAFLTALTQSTDLRGLANLSARTGRPFAAMLPEWTFALALDDYPGFTTSLGNIKMLSWNFRNVFAGLNADFPSTFTQAWPLAVTPSTFGAFTATGGVLPGTAQFFTLSGAQAAKQLIELKASGSNADAPAELRIAIVRVF
jgi:hypothetical protein